MFQGSKSSTNHPFPLTFLCLMVAIILPLAACGGGGGGGTTTDTSTVTALSLPDRIQLTNNDESASSARAARSLSSLLSRSAGIPRSAYNDAGTAYTNAVKRSWVDDTDALNMINTILGVCAETSYGDFVNQGPYVALVRDTDENKESQSGTSATSTTTEKLMEIIVDVTRASNSDPMIIKVWLYTEGPSDSMMLVRGYFTVTQGVSDEYPYGVMEAHFKGNALGNDDSIGDEIMWLALSVSAENGNVILENVDDEGVSGGWEAHRRVRVVANADITEGNAYLYDQESNCDDSNVCTLPPATIAQIAFNPTHFKQEVVGGTTKVYAKDDYQHRVFRYKLFDADTGANITRSSGFPIQTADGKNGYVGYYGLWMNNNATLAHGTAVYDMNDNPYTVFKSAGKLTKHTRSQMLLSELDGVELSKWDSTTNKDLIVAWDIDSQTFKTLGYRDQEIGQIVYDNTGLPANVTFQEWEGAWCEPLKSYLRLGSLYGNSPTPGNGDTLSYHTEETVNPNDATDLTLYTWSFTLGLPVTQTIVDNAATAENDYWNNMSEKTFHFTAADMMLYDESNNPVTIPSTVTISQNSNLYYGYHIGPLTTASIADEADSWQAAEAEVYYTWNTGSDEWNQFVSVKDGNGTFADFQPPLSFAYTHTTTNDVNDDPTFNNKKFRLEYDGFSVNIPWEFDPQANEWVPQINIADGTLMGPGNAYVIKGIEEALIMSEVSPTGITFANEVILEEPGLTYDATKTALVGDVPTGAELKVIKGEVLE